MVNVTLVFSVNVTKLRYQEQLEALADSLVRFFIIDMQAQMARDQKEILLKVRRVLSAVNDEKQIGRAHV